MNNRCISGQSFVFNDVIARTIPTTTTTRSAKTELIRVDIPSDAYINEIDLDSASFGLFLDLTEATLAPTINVNVPLYQKISCLKFDDNQNVTLNFINKNDPTSINLVGGSQLTIETENPRSQIKLGHISPIKNSKNPFIIKSNVPLSADSIDLYESASIKALVPSLTAKAVSVKQAASATIENIQIDNVLDVGVLSQIRFESNSKFNTNAKINVNYTSTTKTNFASLIGQLPSTPPQEFNMVMDNNRALEDTPRFLLAQNSKGSQFKCTVWQETCKSTIGYSDLFNDCQCLSDEADKAADSANLFVVPSVTDRGKKKPLSKGGIAGIVIACIVVVAAIAIGVFYFIRWHKKDKDLSDLEDDYNNDNSNQKTKEA